jgi:hypothetical protein
MGYAMLCVALVSLNFVCQNVYAPYYETSMKILPISLTLKEKQNLPEGKIPNFTGLLPRGHVFTIDV